MLFSKPNVNSMNKKSLRTETYIWCFGSPSTGKNFIDCELFVLGTVNKVKFSNFKGKWIVLETGSSTCSMYTKNIPDMKGIEGEFPDAKFLMIYVR